MDWRTYLMGFALWASKKSKDPSTQVGAVAVGTANNILETGYNGLPRGVDDLSDRMERPAKYMWTGHAEENLVAHAARPRLNGSTVYVTHMCCARCARSLINAGVACVVVGPGKTSMPPEEFEIANQMFYEAGVKLVYRTADPTSGGKSE
jgi:dCMP deaminase